MQPSEINQHVKAIADAIQRDAKPPIDDAEKAARDAVVALATMVLTDLHWIANSLYRMAEQSANASALFGRQASPTVAEADEARKAVFGNPI
jgi:hypothetical protein